MNTTFQIPALSNISLNNLPQATTEESLKNNINRRRSSYIPKKPTNRKNTSPRNNLCIIIKPISKKPPQPTKEKKEKCLTDITNENDQKPEQEQYIESLKGALSQALDENDMVILR